MPPIFIIFLVGICRLISEGDEQELEAEVEVEYTFVLTDEWKEFFAKSEAKRRLGTWRILSVPFYGHC